MFNSLQLQLFQFVQEKCVETSMPVYVVGGMVRDIFLGKDPVDKDIDFIVEGDAARFAEICQKQTGGKLIKYDDFYTAKILSPSAFIGINEIDFASAREEVYASPGKLPVVRKSTIREDLKRRDFSINAMALSLTVLLTHCEEGCGDLEKLYAEALDFFDGYKDLKAKKIRVLHDKSFTDDPTRIFRAFRYAARISGDLEKGTEELLRLAVAEDCFATVSKQRILNELRKILEEANFQIAFELLKSNGILRKLFIYAEDSHEQVMNLLCSLRKKQLRQDDLYFAVAVRIFFYCSSIFQSPTFVGQKFAELGFGSREIKKITFETRTDLDLSTERTIRRLSIAGAIFQELVNQGDSLLLLQDYTKKIVSS